MVKVLRLLDTSAEIDPVRLECSRRLASTVALMDRFVSLILRFTPHLTERIPTMMADDDFWALKRREPIVLCRKTSVSQEIVNLSELLVAVSRQNNNSAELRSSFRNRWADEPLQQYTTTNLEYHRQKDSLRSFLHMHMLYHHIGQLLYFSNLGHECHAHARATADIVDYAWREGDFDIHNYMAGQILTLASVVLSHALLMKPSVEDERRKVCIRQTVARVRYHTRMFNWVVRIPGCGLVRTISDTDWYSINVWTNGKQRRLPHKSSRKRVCWTRSHFLAANSRSSIILVLVGAQAEQPMLDG